MTNTNLITWLAAALLVVSCSTRNKTVTHVSDYEQYLTSKQAEGYNLETDIKFWHNRLVRMPADHASLIKLAGLHAAKFKLAGDIRDMHISDSIFTALILQDSSQAGILLALAQNAITQHRFKDARHYAERALQTGDQKAASLLVLTDACLELGDVPRAKNILKSFTNKNSFAHLIRQSKVKDQEGDLDSAILLMETAFERIKGNKDLYCWSLSNLGDMYGHAGRVEDAYNAYLSVLQKNPRYDYALKGIAWIALSHDKNYSEAKRLVTLLASRKRIPEANLMLAEIAELENNADEKSKQVAAFLDLTNHAAYKTMYAKYLANVYANELQKPEISLQIAEEECKNRPTAHSYLLKAWALYKLGRFEEATSIAQHYVEGVTFEPEAYYQLGMIYLAAGNKKKAKGYLHQAEEAAFELGPLVIQAVQETLKKI
jgi:tetratricopeptide (TPR) repeat protein